MGRLINTVKHLINLGVTTDIEVASYYLDLSVRKENDLYYDLKLIIRDLENLKPFGLSRDLKALLEIYKANQFEKNKNKPLNE
ncbi:hypothetical protein BpOF4_20779 (plasmid) [Alkalihalophilus pseudofirmus OF4]|uniref:Uncharacterized protein n=1 Tax=Alkalihalophilus pseudofirmus (strain ATCC BAA-2126 / JCM 17055 / OF4) TaxID=398511 RepID=D3G1C5_ALKPO|nr:hypothetical protein [Alkalihalophilus pseudofirmus]ADC52151.1 hypothetical protein BpOF4_20779 [Alkalihalophilus pseudofirmus OF4]